MPFGTLRIARTLHRNKGIGSKVLQLLVEHCKAEKLFTSTNRSNLAMQKALARSKFSYAGKLIGLDQGDPELFFFKSTKKG